MKKRHFLVLAAGAGGAALMGWGLKPPSTRTDSPKSLRGAENDLVLNAWLVLQANGRLGLVMPRAEMGQGVWTGLSMIVAEELSWPLDQIDLLPAPIDKVYGNVLAMADSLPFHPQDQGRIARTARWFGDRIGRELGFMMTGGSASIRDLWDPLRWAAASMKWVIVKRASELWGIPATDIQCSYASIKRWASRARNKAVGRRMVQG
jgi:isoquinoline 1-oxidoreductase subunit beta